MLARCRPNRNDFGGSRTPCSVQGRMATGRTCFGTMSCHLRFLTRDGPRRSNDAGCGDLMGSSERPTKLAPLRKFQQACDARESLDLPAMCNTSAVVTNGPDRLGPCRSRRRLHRSRRRGCARAPLRCRGPAGSREPCTSRGNSPGTTRGGGGTARSSSAARRARPKLSCLRPHLGRAR